MPGITPLKRIQIGLENTRGTAVAASQIWRGTGSLEDQRVLEFPEEHVGYLLPPTRSYTPALLGSIDFDSIPATFEELPVILACSIRNVTAGTANGSGFNYVYSWPHTIGTVVTALTATIEGGDNQQAEEMEYSYVENFTLEGSTGEALMLSATWNGRQIQTTSFTSLTLGTSDKDVEEILFSRGTIFIDDLTIGTTQLENTMLGMTLNVDTGQEHVYTAEGNLTFTFVKQAQPEITLDVVMEHNATSALEVADWRNQTDRLVRLNFIGTALNTAGLTPAASNYLLRIDMAGRWESFGPIDDQDQDSILTGTLNARFNIPDDLYCTITVINTLANLD